MTDRTTIITSTQAAQAFPRLARFLAESTTIAPDVAEQALQATCNDYVAAEQTADIRAGWSRAAATTNASRGLASHEPPAATAETTPASSWSAAVDNVNGQRGAI